MFYYKFFFQIKEKLRVHFNSFMLNIHARIHELKIKSGKGASSFRDEGSKPFDPIPPVAADITQESWLICFDEFQVSEIKCKLSSLEIRCIWSYLPKYLWFAITLLSMY